MNNKVNQIITIRAAFLPRRIEQNTMTRSCAAAAALNRTHSVKDHLIFTTFPPFSPPTGENTWLQFLHHKRSGRPYWEMMTTRFHSLQRALLFPHWIDISVDQWLVHLQLSLPGGKGKRKKGERKRAGVKGEKCYLENALRPQNFTSSTRDDLGWAAFTQSEHTRTQKEGKKKLSERSCKKKWQFASLYLQPTDRRSSVQKLNLAVKRKEN